MALSEVYSGSDTFTTTEESIAANTNATTAQSITDDGVYQVWLDLSNLANGDSFRLQIKEKVQSSGTQRVVETFVFTDVQSNPNFASPALMLLHGWDVTIAKLAGTNRAIPWSIRKAV
jgi:hypothetical protein